MRKLFYVLAILSFVYCTASSQGIGQVTTNWTSEIPTSRLPSGATVPTVAALTNPFSVNFTVDLTPASDFDNATKTTAWTAIGNAVQDTIDANRIISYWGIDTSLTITGRIVITDVTRRWDNFESGSLPNQYTAATDIFRVVGRFEWVLE